MSLDIAHNFFTSYLSISLSTMDAIVKHTTIAIAQIHTSIAKASTQASVSL